MGSRKEYWCDLCDEQFIDGPGKNLVGLRFKNNHDFVLGTPKDTDGHHICMRCLGQIYSQAPTILAGG